MRTLPASLLLIAVVFGACSVPLRGATITTQPGHLVNGVFGAADSRSKNSGGFVVGGKPRPPTFVDGKLRFRPDGTFKILQITDLHYGEGTELDIQSNEVQKVVLEAEQPDLVVFSGDMVSGWECKPSQPRLPDCGPGWFDARWRQLISPVHEAGIPYAIILGNHDAEAELSRREIVDLDITSGGLWSLTRQGPPEATGASNYWLDIYPHLPATTAGADGGGGCGGGGGGLKPSCDSSSGNGARDGGAAQNQAAARIWLLDSGDRTCPPLMFGWGCVAEDTLAWVNRTAARLTPVPSLAFVHIPVLQFQGVWDDEPTMGRKQEDVACSVRDTGLFELAKRAGIHAIYSGHDHNNDYWGVKEGVRLAYGRKSGRGGYGPPEGWLRGARVIQLRVGEDTALSETWIRQEDGSKLLQQPSTEAKGMRQLVCHCDELEQALMHYQQQQLQLQHQQEQNDQQEQQGASPVTDTRCDATRVVA